jgi:ATP-dependent DNA helicase RecG
MIKLDSPVSALTKVGPKYKALLGKLDIYTITDLLYHFPFRYEDYSQIKKIKDVEIGETVTVEARLASIQNIFTKYRKRLTKAKVIDYTGELDLIWFNQHYLKTVLKVEKTYYFSGKIDTFANKKCFISPDYEEKIGESINTGRLVPIYPETSGISSKWIRTRINDVLNAETDLEEFLPQETLNKENLQDIKCAMEQIHFPSGESDAKISRERFAFEELFLELLNVEKRKSDWSEKLKGHGFKKFSEEISKFIKTLPFELTDSQKIAVEEILNDLQSKQPMNRLLEGDVGTGKTVASIVATYLTHLNGYKTLYMAPTEILAHQHLKTFKDLLEPAGLKISLSTGSQKPKEKDWDVLVGTHSLLFSKEKYEKVGFVVIDEQHRFGVEQRGKILELSKSRKVPHLLTMTATPIPRTLALTLYGDLSISVLKTHPNVNRKITTKVIPEKQREAAYKWILSKNEPAFIVCPLIEESEHESLENVKSAEEEFKKLKEGVFKDVAIGLLHGRMKPKEKQEVIEKFKSGKIKVLVSTPVIEVGIDVPEATIMVIESAERYGLASLHQLRGRVGRGEKEGFCFVFMSTNNSKAYTRLKYLERFLSGLELAEIDMKLRGEGDVFGTTQHGFKKFKVATLSDLKLLERSKLSAQIIFPKIEKYPKLLEKLNEKSGKFVKNN